MSITREQCKETVLKVLKKDQEEFKEFYKQYDRIVWNHAMKWSSSISDASINMYELCDIHNELWEHAWKNLHKYDSTRSNIASWMYLVCNTKASMIYRDLKSSSRKPELNNLYLYDSVYEGDDGKELEMIDMIMDPKEAFDNLCISEAKVNDYIYILKDFVSGLNYQQTVVYLQSIRGEMKEREISDLLGISQSYVNRIRNKLMAKAFKLWEKLDKTYINHKEVDRFSLLLLSPISDNDLSDQLNCSLAVIKVCREVLALADIYDKNGE